VYSPREADLTAMARIRNAALERFPRDGFRGTTVRSVADDAGGSPGLIVHHFATKEGLREACDEYVIEQIRTVKRDAINIGQARRPGDHCRRIQDRPSADAVPGLVSGLG
jgi:AcrR family transcriptional regulator